MVSVSEAFVPVVLKGVTIHPEDPLLFDFIVDNGQSGLKGQGLTDETTKLVKYFLAGLAVPEKDLWVNLSPKEQDRIMADELSHTDVGRDMLAQDYMLKQVTASLMYPEKDLGRKFWDEVYKRSYEKFGNTNIPVGTFNKVWIMPAEATVYQNGNNAIVAQSHLKVMLESDYQLARGQSVVSSAQTIELAKDVVRSVILPVLEKEVNEGRNFASLRQVFASMILAGWYKNALKESLLAQVYSNTNKVNGIEIAEKDAKEKVYAQYMEAYQKGVYNYIKEEFDQNTNETTPRRYFSGGVTWDAAMAPRVIADASQVPEVVGETSRLTYKIHPLIQDAAQGFSWKYGADINQILMEIKFQIDDLSKAFGTTQEIVLELRKRRSFSRRRLFPGLSVWYAVRDHFSTLYGDDYKNVAEVAASIFVEAAEEKYYQYSQRAVFSGMISPFGLLAMGALYSYFPSVEVDLSCVGVFLSGITGFGGLASLWCHAAFKQDIQEGLKLLEKEFQREDISMDAAQGFSWKYGADINQILFDITFKIRSLLQQDQTPDEIVNELRKIKKTDVKKRLLHMMPVWYAARDKFLDLYGSDKKSLAEVAASVLVGEIDQVYYKYTQRASIARITGIVGLLAMGAVYHFFPSDSLDLSLAGILVSETAGLGGLGALWYHAALKQDIESGVQRMLQESAEKMLSFPLAEDPLAVKGGIDLGLADYIRVSVLDPLDQHVFHSDQADQLQKDLKGFTPVFISISEKVNFGKFLR